MVHPVGREAKKALLAHLIQASDWHQVLVFTRMKHGANRAGRIPDEKQGITAMAIHGNKSQGARNALADFKSGKLWVLVATDIAAAASTSTSCRTSSTSTCPTCRKTTCTASAAPAWFRAAPAARPA